MIVIACCCLFPGGHFRTSLPGFSPLDYSLCGFGYNMPDVFPVVANYYTFFL